MRFVFFGNTLPSATNVTNCATCCDEHEPDEISPEGSEGGEFTCATNVRGKRQQANNHNMPIFS